MRAVVAGGRPGPVKNEHGAVFGKCVHNSPPLRALHTSFEDELGVFLLLFFFSLLLSSHFYFLSISPSLDQKSDPAPHSPLFSIFPTTVCALFLSREDSSPFFPLSSRLELRSVACIRRFAVHRNFDRLIAEYRPLFALGWF